MQINITRHGLDYFSKLIHPENMYIHTCTQIYIYLFLFFFRKSNQIPRFLYSFSSLIISLQELYSTEKYPQGSTTRYQVLTRLVLGGRPFGSFPIFPEHSSGSRVCPFGVLLSPVSTVSLFFLSIRHPALSTLD